MPQLQGKGKLLASYGPVTAFALVVICITKVSSIDSSAAKAVAAAEIAKSDSYFENVSAIGTVIQNKLSKDGQGHVLTLEGADGFPYTAYISPAVQHVPLTIGDKVEVTGSSIGKGAIAVSKPKGLAIVKKRGIAHTIYSVEIQGGTARWQAGEFVAKVKTTLPDGYYNCLVVQADSSGRKVLVNPSGD